MSPTLTKLVRRRLSNWARQSPGAARLARSIDPAHDGEPDTIAERIGADEPLFGRMFTAPAHRTTRSPQVLDALILKAAQSIDSRQPGYQPVYGFETEFPGKRRTHLDRNVTLVEDLLHTVKAKHQVRILDVGCNNGYVSLRLAEKFPNVVGLEISRDQLRLCRLLAARANSTARFFADDILQVLASGRDDFANVDLALLYNVVHQFIFLHGIEYTKALIARLASRVDDVIVELAHREDYVKNGKDRLLPERAEDVLADCANVTITKLREAPRPVYRLQRKSVRLGPLAIEPQRVDYSLNPDPMTSRKYYVAEETFLKVFRYTEPRQVDDFQSEVSALLRMRDTSYAPRLLEWTTDDRCGAILMTNVGAKRLAGVIYGKSGAALKRWHRLEFTRQYVKIAKAVYDRIGYQNDLQPHNFVVGQSGNLVLVDYEQAQKDPTNDPFGLLLWSVFQIWGGRDEHRPAAIRSLRLGRLPDQASLSPPVYPDFTGLKLDPTVRELVDDAARGGDWGQFLARWHSRWDVEAEPVGDAPPTA